MIQPFSPRLTYPKVFIYLCVSFMLGSCSCQNESGKWLKNRHSNFDGGSLNIAESQLSLPIRLPLSEIESALNAKIPPTLIKRKEIKHGIKLTITRGGAVVLSGEHQTLNWSIPLEVTVSHDFVGGNITTFQLMPLFSSELKLQEDYGIRSETKLNSIKWMSSAVIKVLGMELDVTNIVDGLIQDESQKITSLIDGELQKLNLKTILAKTWNKLSNPLRINRHVQPLYLTIDARQLTLHNFRFQKGQLAVDLSVAGMLNTVFDSLSNTRSDVPYPPLTLNDNKPKENALFLPLVVGFDRINSLLKDRLFGFEFAVKDRNLRIDSVNVTSVDSFLLITGAISGDVNVALEILGRPEYIPSTKTLTVRGFDFYVKNTSESLLNAGDYFFHDEIIEEVLTQLNLPIGSFIDTIPALIYRGIERGKSGDNINVYTELDSISLDQFLVRYDDIALVLFASGKVAIQVEKLKPKT